MAVPEDMAGAVAHLRSDEAALVTGQVLTVNGGHVLRATAPRPAARRGVP